MGINKLVIVLCVVVAVKANCNDDLRIIDSIRNEDPCISQGGVCTIAVDCPKGKLVEKTGLCPAQQRRGVECCYGLSVKETRCTKRGGSCSEEGCNKDFIDKLATDCPEGSTCCIYV